MYINKLVFLLLSYLLWKRSQLKTRKGIPFSLLHPLQSESCYYEEKTNHNLVMNSKTVEHRHDEQLHKRCFRLLPVGAGLPGSMRCPTGTTIYGSPEHDDIIFSGRTLPLAFWDHSLPYDFAPGGWHWWMSFSGSQCFLASQEGH